MAATLASSGGGGGTNNNLSPPDQAELKTLRNRCSNLTKERRAVQTIMEQKVKTLVESISKAATTAQQQPGSQQNQDPNGHPLLTREIVALRRLVDASIAVLRNSASSN